MRPIHPRSTPAPLRARPLALWLIAAAVALAALAVPALAKTTVHVHTAQNATLHKRVVVTASGRTLYTLSAEVHRKFICTGACLSTWHPLKVPVGGTVAGVAKLGVVKRPDGSRQATFNGRPLYTFSGDRKKGDANGEGFKDVGTWRAAAVSSSKASSPAPSGGGGVGY